MTVEYYIYYLYYTFLGYPFIIKFAVVAIYFYVPFFLYAIGRLAYERNKFYTKRSIRESLLEKYGKDIEEIATAREVYSRDEIADKFQALTKKDSPIKKRALTNIILSVESRSVHVNKENVERMVDCLGISKFWERKLKYGSTASKQKSLRKLEDLGIGIPGSVITFLTYNSNRYLRKRARSSYLFFSKNNPYKFFEEDFDRTFNDWDKVEIHKKLSRREGERLPSLSQWIKNSKNNDFKCFLVDEIRHFRQKECCPFLLELVVTEEDIMLKKSCVDALGELEYSKAEDILIEGYPLQPVTIQQSIVKAVQKINSGKSLPFLKEAWHNASDVESRKIILSAIYNYGNTGRTLFESMKNDSDGFQAQIFGHVSNPLIKYI